MNDGDRKDILHPQAMEAIRVNQDIIRRLAGNAQKTKIFFLATCALCAVLAGDEPLPPQAMLLLVAVTLVFWFMDANYLRLERQFRQHHNAIVSNSIPLYECLMFNPHKYEVPSMLRTMFSFSEAMYPAILLLVMALFQ